MSRLLGIRFAEEAVGSRRAESYVLMKLGSSKLAI